MLVFPQHTDTKTFSNLGATKFLQSPDAKHAPQMATVKRCVHVQEHGAIKAGVTDATSSGIFWSLLYKTFSSGRGLTIH